MKIPTISGIIRRRILLNYRVDPAVIQKQLPENFRPKLVNGYAIAGICLIRMEEIRPKGMPAAAGISSENSAHRIAVEWNDENGAREGVYIPRRDTDSRLNAITGGRIFPGVHHLSKFTVSDQAERISIRVDAKDSQVPLLDLSVSESDALPSGSVFGSIQESSDFFEAGCVGYSSRPGSPVLDGLKLVVDDWQVLPLHVDSVRSNYFDDQKCFPEGNIELDHALLMRNIPHEWHAEAPMTTNR